MKEMDSTKMEFLLTLNDNIVVQRFFNVRGFNPKAKNSVDLYEYIKALKEELQYYLKMKTVVYMMDNRDAISHDPKIMDTSFTDGPEIFNLFVRVGEQTIVRYTVDVRPFLKDVLRDLTDIFSNNKLSYQYLDFETSK
jgi:hypothetical protein